MDDGTKELTATLLIDELQRTAVRMTSSCTGRFGFALYVTELPDGRVHVASNLDTVCICKVVEGHLAILRG